jgi:hypothetical protein
MLRLPTRERFGDVTTKGHNSELDDVNLKEEPHKRLRRPSKENISKLWRETNHLIERVELFRSWWTESVLFRNRRVVNILCQVLLSLYITD